MNDYEGWCEKHQPGDGIMRGPRSSARHDLRAKPALVPSAPPPANPLAISRFWKLDGTPGAAGDDSRSFVDPRTLVVQGQTAWVMTLLQPGKVVGFDTSTMQTVQTIEVPAELVPRQHTSRAHPPVSRGHAGLDRTGRGIDWRCFIRAAAALDEARRSPDVLQAALDRRAALSAL
ncbi:MAG: hypothetical protein WDO13_00705 [Verrucomicrobiota bacterium]